MPKRLSLDVAFFHILLASASFLPAACGPKTIYEPPPGSCFTESKSTIYPGELSADGGTGGYYGARDDGGLPLRLTSAECDVACKTKETRDCKPIDGNEYFLTVMCRVPCPTPIGGRRPEALSPLDTKTDDALARYFSELAYLEAASVHAFTRLGDELRAHGASARLTRAATRAAQDEVRHTRVIASLVRRHGGVIDLPARGPAHVRALDEIAMENAVEGCVRESFGALIAWVQSARAADPRIRRALRAIAADETEHARLAFAVNSFCRARIDDQKWRQIEDARDEAVRELWRETDADAHPALLLTAGLPSRDAKKRMLAEAQRTLWS